MAEHFVNLVVAVAVRAEGDRRLRRASTMGARRCRAPVVICACADPFAFIVQIFPTEIEGGRRALEGDLRSVG